MSRDIGTGTSNLEGVTICSKKWLPPMTRPPSGTPQGCHPGREADTWPSTLWQSAAQNNRFEVTLRKVVSGNVRQGLLNVRPKSDGRPE
jgi:hypothetical protein